MQRDARLSAKRHAPGGTRAGRRRLLEGHGRGATVPYVRQLFRARRLQLDGGRQ